MEEQDNRNNSLMLQNRFQFSFMNPNDNITNMNYEQGLIKIGEIGSVQDFWNYYCHINRPSELNSGSFYLFLSNVQPMWEDAANKGGGRFCIKMRKGFVNKIWEDLIIGFIGETCDDKDLLNGLVLQIRKDQDIIQLWVREIPKHRSSAKNRIQNWIYHTIGIDQSDHALAPNTIAFQLHQREQNNRFQPSNGSQKI